VAETVVAAARDREAILRVAADYIESWFEGDAEQMRRSLHPDLVKRSLDRGGLAGEPKLETIGAEDMVRATGAGTGTKYPRGHEVAILDLYDEMATVRVTSTPYVEYLHLARFGGRWLIVNVLWQRRAESAPDR
jgi:Putative lumazine-binding